MKKSNMESCGKRPSFQKLFCETVAASPGLLILAGYVTRALIDAIMATLTSLHGGDERHCRSVLLCMKLVSTKGSE